METDVKQLKESILKVANEMLDIKLQLAIICTNQETVSVPDFLASVAEKTIVITELNNKIELIIRESLGYSFPDPERKVFKRLTEFQSGLLLAIFKEEDSKINYKEWVADCKFLEDLGLINSRENCLTVEGVKQVILINNSKKVYLK